MAVYDDDMIQTLTGFALIVKAKASQILYNSYRDIMVQFLFFK